MESKSAQRGSGRARLWAMQTAALARLKFEPARQVATFRNLGGRDFEPLGTLPEIAPVHLCRGLGL